MHRAHFFYYDILLNIGVSAAGSTVGTQKTMVEKNIKANNQERACSRR